MRKIINTNSIVLPKENLLGKENETITITTVLIFDDTTRRYKCYMGAGSDEYIKTKGVKLLYSEAVNYFLMLLKENYD